MDKIAIHENLSSELFDYTYEEPKKGVTKEWLNDNVKTGYKVSRMELLSYADTLLVPLSKIIVTQETSTTKWRIDALAGVVTAHADSDIIEPNALAPTGVFNNHFLKHFRLAVPSGPNPYNGLHWKWFTEKLGVGSSFPQAPKKIGNKWYFTLYSPIDRDEEGLLVQDGVFLAYSGGFSAILFKTWNAMTNQIKIALTNKLNDGEPDVDDTDFDINIPKLMDNDIEEGVHSMIVDLAINKSTRGPHYIRGMLYYNYDSSSSCSYTLCFGVDKYTDTNGNDYILVESTHSLSNLLPT